MYSLLPSLLELGDAVSHNLEFAYREDTRISFGEETITELNLLTLQQRHPGRVRIETFSKPKEVKNGSDWEWMIIGDYWTYRARIQAKRIDRKGALKGLFRKSKTATQTQIDALISGAAAEKIRALYCFYCTDAHRKVWKAPYDQYQTGCLIADAKRVKKLSDHKFTDVEPISVPWHFLFCEDRFLKIDQQTYFTRDVSDPPRIRPFGFPAGKFDAATDSEKTKIVDPLSFEERPIGQLLNRAQVDGEESLLENEIGIERTSLDRIGTVLHPDRDRESAPIGVIALDISQKRYFQ